MPIAYCYFTLYSTEAMAWFGLEKLTIDNLNRMAQLMDMPKFPKKMNKADMAKKVEKHLIWAFEKD